MKDEQARVLTVGAATWDLIFRIDEIPTTPTKVVADECVEVGSGMATSAAVAIAADGGLARVLSAVGDDSLGQRYLDDIDSRGVDTSTVRQVTGARTAVSSILVDVNGERLVCPFYDAALRASSLDGIENALADCDAVMVDVRWPAAAEVIMRAAKARGIPSVLDADVAPNAVLHQLVPLADHVVFSADALLQFRPANSANEALRALSDEGIAAHGCLGTTLGADGFTGRDTEQWFSHPGLPAPSPVVDTLAAGDTWHGLFTLALARGHDIDAAVQRALAGATLKCTVFGGNRGAPTRSAIDAFIASHAKQR